MATETFVTDAIAAIPEVDLTGHETIVSNDAKLALKADKTELDGLATVTFVTDAIAAIPATDLSGFETIVVNDSKLALKADKTEVSSAVNTAVSNLVNGAPETFNTLKKSLIGLRGDGVNTTELTNAIANKADRSEVDAVDAKVEALVIPSIGGLATETFVTDAIAAIPATDLTEYVRKNEVTSEISAAIAQAQLDGGDVDLSAYETIVSNDGKLALKADKTELVGLATETYVG